MQRMSKQLSQENLIESKNNKDIINMVKRATEPTMIESDDTSLLVEQFMPTPFLGSVKIGNDDDMINLQIPLHKPASPHQYIETIKDDDSEEVSVDLSKSLPSLQTFL